MRELPESDWRYMRDLKPELLNRLCARINTRTAKLLADPALTEHERYLQVYKHVHAADKIVAECFNDWRRSHLLNSILALLHHQLLTPKELANLSEEGQALVGFFSRE